MDESCASCVYWEGQGQWGRCWAPESDGRNLGLLVDGGILTVRDDFYCSAYEEGDYDEAEVDEDDA